MNTSIKKSILPTALFAFAWFLSLFWQTDFYHIQISTLIAFGLLFISLSFCIKNRIRYHDIFFFLIFLLGLTLISTYIFGSKPHAFAELLKVMIVFAGGLLLARTLEEKSLYQLLITFPYIYITGLTSILLFWGVSLRGEIYGRLGFYHSLGSPNTIGFFLAAALILLVFQSRKNGNINVLNWIYIFLGLILISLTFSRSAIFGFLLSLIFTAWSYRKSNLINHYKLLVIGFLSILFLMAAPHLASYFLVSNPLIAKPHFLKHEDQLDKQEQPQWEGNFTPQLNKERFYFNNPKNGDQFDSGRLQVWSWIAKESFSQPSRLLFGLGPGLLPETPTKKTNSSIDSLPFMALYSYGIAGLIISVIFLIRLIFNNVNADLNSNSQKILKTAFSMLMFFTLAVNNSTSAQQLMLLGMLIIGFIFSKSSNHTIQGR